MNQTAQRLGMTQTSYVNPNGLPADGQSPRPAILRSSPRSDRDLPEYEYFYHIPRSGSAGGSSTISTS